MVLEPTVLIYKLDCPPGKKDSNLILIKSKLWIADGISRCPITLSNSTGLSLHLGHLLSPTMHCPWEARTAANYCSLFSVKNHTKSKSVRVRQEGYIIGRTRERGNKNKTNKQSKQKEKKIQEKDRNNRV